jgi:hypothetical protein
MRALRLLKKIVLGVIAAILGVYLVFAIGLTVLEWVVRENPKVDESLLAHSTAPHTITHFDQGAASFQRRLELIAPPGSRSRSSSSSTTSMMPRASSPRR